MQKFVVSVLALGLFAIGAPHAQAVNLRPNVPEGSVSITLNPVVQYNPDLSTEFTPIDMVPFPDGTGRLAVSTVLGTIRVMDANRTLVPTPLLTKAQSGLVPPQEAGMTGIAFHPDFNHVGTFGYGKLYTITTEPRTDTVDGPQTNNVDFSFSTTVYENYQDVVREWNLASFGSVPGNAGNNAFTGTLSNSREILRVDQPGPFHDVADLTFNRHAQPGDTDYGLLYITAGDGGDQHGEPATSAIRRNRAQTLDNIYGKILRIDPDPSRQPIQRTSGKTGLPSYSVPTSNPFASDNVPETRTSSSIAEIYAYGFRSAWRLEFDRTNGDLWEGDVGENSREEINKIVAGANYGWGQVEGTLDGILPGDGTQLPGLTKPFFELTHSDSHSIDGGFVYHGSAIPALQGKYVFGDLGQGFSTGALFYGVINSSDPDFGKIFEFQFTAGTPTFNGLALPPRIYSFGEDDAGELYFSAGPDPRNPPDPSQPAYIIRLEPSGMLTGVAGDIDQNGVLDPIVDVAKFVQGWKTTGWSGDVARYTHGDINLDGKTNLTDVWLMHQALQTVGASFPFSALVPEPSSALFLLFAMAAMIGGRQRRLAARR